MVEKGGKNKELLVIKNINKTAMAEIAKVLNVIDLKTKYSWTISNTEIDVAENFGLINIKKC